MSCSAVIGEMLSHVGFDGAYEPDGDGIFRFEANGFEIALRETDDYPVLGMRSLAVWAPFGALPSDGADAYMDWMLRANARPETLAGGALSLENGTCYLHRVLDARLLDAGTLERELTAFVGVLADWRDRLRSGVVPDDDGFLRIEGD